VIKTHAKNKMSEQIWFKDPSILFTKDTWNRFVPMKNMTTVEALNAVVRFSIYFSVILFVSTGVGGYIMAIPLVMIASIVLYKLFPNGKALEEAFTVRDSKKTTNFTMPTAENPFMNVLLTEIKDNPDREDAAPTGRRDVKRKINEAFAKTSDLYMDTSDVFDQAQAMRTFHTLQSAKVPNDQDGFLKWMTKGYDTPDFSSAFPARQAKLQSEGHVVAKGSLRGLPSSTSKPTGTTPSATPLAAK